MSFYIHNILTPVLTYKNFIKYYNDKKIINSLDKHKSYKIIFDYNIIYPIYKSYVNQINCLNQIINILTRNVFEDRHLKKTTTQFLNRVKIESYNLNKKLKYKIKSDIDKYKKFFKKNNINKYDFTIYIKKIEKNNNKDLKKYVNINGNFIRKKNKKIYSILDFTRMYKNIYDNVLYFNN